MGDSGYALWEEIKALYAQDNRLPGKAWRAKSDRGAEGITFEDEFIYDRQVIEPYKLGLNLRGKATTKPGKIMIERIPIKTFSEWGGTEPGYMEIDMVAYCGGSLRGEFYYTLNCVDVATGWVEMEVVKNRSRERTVEALEAIKGRLPFELKGIHSDNGSEFINGHFLCELFSANDEIKGEGEGR